MKEFMILSLERIFRMNVMLFSRLQRTIIGIRLDSVYQWAEAGRGSWVFKGLTRNSQGRVGGGAVWEPRVCCIIEAEGQLPALWCLGGKRPMTWCGLPVTMAVQTERPGRRYRTFPEREKSSKTLTFTFCVLSRIYMSLILANLEKKNSLLPTTCEQNSWRLLEEKLKQVSKFSSWKGCSSFWNNILPTFFSEWQILCHFWNHDNSWNLSF